MTCILLSREIGGIPVDIVLTDRKTISGADVDAALARLDLSDSAKNG